MNLLKSKQDCCPRFHLHLEQRFRSTTFELVPGEERLLSSVCLFVLFPRPRRMQSALPVGCWNTQLEGELQVRQLLQEDGPHLVCNCSAQSKGVHLSLLGLEHHAL